MPPAPCTLAAISSLAGVHAAAAHPAAVTAGWKGENGMQGRYMTKGGWADGCDEQNDTLQGG